MKPTPLSQKQIIRCTTVAVTVLITCIVLPATLFTTQSISSLHHTTSSSSQSTTTVVTKQGAYQEATEYIPDALVPLNNAVTTYCTDVTLPIPSTGSGREDICTSGRTTYTKTSATKKKTVSPQPTLSALQADNPEIPCSKIELPSNGTLYGNIRVSGTTVNAPLYFGDSPAILNKGAGQYMGSSYPGCGSTVLIGGHSHSFFAGLQQVETGAYITLSTTYGTYVYQVTHTAIKQQTDSTAYDLSSTKENLVLYTCYPFDSMGQTSRRKFVYSKYISGPVLLIDK